MPSHRAPRTWSRLIAHHFTVDVEEYFQVSAFDRYVSRANWPRLETRVAKGVAILLDLLARHGARATFFVLGWVAERHPAVVRDIANAGHEVASHGWDHRRVTEQTKGEFRRSIHSSKQTLEQLTGTEILGFRAPNFSIVPGCEWALDTLLEEGYRYDSSLFPARRLHSGYPGAQLDPHWLNRPAGRLMEVPPAVVRFGGVTIPAGGGAYFRVLPYQLTRTALKGCEARGAPGTFYIHPWELDPGQPRFDVPWPTRLRHYTGLSSVAARLERLCREFRFGAIADTVAACAELGAGV